MPKFTQAPGGAATTLPGAWVSLQGANDLITPNKYIPNSTLQSLLNLSQADAIIDGVGTNAGTYATVAAAIAAGKRWIRQDVPTTESTVGVAFTVPRTTTIYLNYTGSASPSNWGKVTINSDCQLNIVSPCSGKLNAPKLFIGATSGACFTGAGILYLSGVHVENSGSVTLSNVETYAYDCKLDDSGAVTGFVNISSGILQNNLLVTQNSGAVDTNILIAGADCVANKNEILVDIGALNGVLVTIEDGAKVSGLKITNDSTSLNPLKINVTGYLDSISCDNNASLAITVNGGTLANSTLANGSGIGVGVGFIKCIGNSSMLLNNKFNDMNVSVDVAANFASLTNNITTGVYTNDGTDTQAQGNHGSIVNTGS